MNILLSKNICTPIITSMFEDMQEYDACDLCLKTVTSTGCGCVSVLLLPYSLSVWCVCVCVCGVCVGCHENGLCRLCWRAVCLPV